MDHSIRWSIVRSEQIIPEGMQLASPAEDLSTLAATNLDQVTPLVAVGVSVGEAGCCVQGLVDVADQVQKPGQVIRSHLVSNAMGRSQCRTEGGDLGLSVG